MESPSEPPFPEKYHLLDFELVKAVACGGLLAVGRFFKHIKWEPQPHASNHYHREHFIDPPEELNPPMNQAEIDSYFRREYGTER